MSLREISERLTDLTSEAMLELAQSADRFAVHRGEVLFRQGMDADAVYILERGEMQITTRIPGDTYASVANIGPGDVVGEFALLDDGPRSASVTAVIDSAGLRIPKTRFLALLADGKPWTLELIDGLRSLVARRTRDTLSRIAAKERYDVTALRSSSPAQQCLPAGDVTPLFAAVGRLSILGAEGTASLASRGKSLTIPRGASVSDLADPPDFFSLVLRGALRSILPRREGQEQVIVHGPGEVTGLIGLFDGKSQPLGLEAAEDTIVLQMPKAMFEDMRRSPDPTALALFSTIGRQLVRDQRRANRHLGRAVSLEQFNQSIGRSAS